MKIAHISDLHILQMGTFQIKDLVNKRLVGRANLLFHRSAIHSKELVLNAIQTIKDQECEHLAVSGDISNLSLTSEFEAGKELISTFSDDPRTISVVPGNHDYYTYRSARTRRFENIFGIYQQSDLPELTTESGYPFVQFRGEVAIVGVNSCIPSPPFFAVGNIDERELKTLRNLLDHPKMRDKFVVLMLHHPVFDCPHHRIAYFRRLINANKLLDICRRGGVDLLIHGHNHSFLNHALPHLDREGTMRICEPGSISVEKHDDNIFGGKYNIYHIEEGRLVRIETHLYEHVSKTFRRWRDVSY